MCAGPQRAGDAPRASAAAAAVSGLGLSSASAPSVRRQVGQLADLVEPLVEAMFADAFKSPYVCVDATGVLVQAKETRRHRETRFSSFDTEQ